jgi:hypothetical protein
MSIESGGYFGSNSAEKEPEQIRKYRPSNGTEYCMFTEDFCDKCADGGECEIDGRAMIYDLEDKEYPEQWQYDEHGKPVCIEFKKRGEE